MIINLLIKSASQVMKLNHMLPQRMAGTRGQLFLQAWVLQAMVLPVLLAPLVTLVTLVPLVLLVLVLLVLVLLSP